MVFRCVEVKRQLKAVHSLKCMSRQVIAILIKSISPTQNTVNLNIPQPCANVLEKPTDYTKRTLYHWFVFHNDYDTGSMWGRL